jgi:hypothetical protein
MSAYYFREDPDDIGAQCGLICAPRLAVGEEPSAAEIDGPARGYQELPHHQ